MAMVRSQFPDILTPGFDKYFFEAARDKDYPEEYSKIVRVERETRPRRDYRTTRVAGFGLAARKEEMEDIQIASLLQGPQQVFTYVAYALGFEVSRELYEDEVDDSDVFKKAPQQLARAMRRTVEYLAGVFLDDLGVGTSYRAQDGLPVLHTAHILLGGGTYPNKPAVDVDISHAALTAGLLNIENTVDDRGLPIMLRPKKLVISPEDRAIVKRILQSPLLPGGSNNDVNPLYDEDLEVVVSHWKTDKDSWFIIADENPLFCRWRTPLDFFEDERKSSQVGMWYAYMRLVFGAENWRGIYGSVGA